MEAKVNNSEEQRKIRKSRSTLVIVGTGVIMFGVWAALKVFSLILLRTDQTVVEMRDMLFYDQEDITRRDIIIWMIVLAAIYVLFELGIRAFVGLSAIAEGRGKRSGKVYLVFAFILILAGLSAVLFDVIVMMDELAGEDMQGTLTRSDALTSFVIDLTSLVMMIEMVVSAFRVKRYNKKIRETEAGHAA